MLVATNPLPFSAKFSSHSPPPPKQKSERDREYLRPDEVASLIGAARKVGRHGIRDAAIILLMFRHGLRSAELVALKWSNLDLKEGYIEIQRAKHGQQFISTHFLSLHRLNLSIMYQLRLLTRCTNNEERLYYRQDLSCGLPPSGYCLRYAPVILA